MDTNHTETRQADPTEAEKKLYHKPVIAVYGSVTDVTDGPTNSATHTGDGWSPTTRS